MTFNEYKSLVPTEIQDSIQNIHTELSDMEFVEDIKEAKSGIKVRLYVAGISKYENCLNKLSNKMKIELKKQMIVRN